MALRTDLSSSELFTAPPSEVNARVEQFNRVLLNTLDDHAPVTKKTVTVIRPPKPLICEKVSDAILRGREDSVNANGDHLVLQYTGGIQGSETGCA